VPLGQGLGLVPLTDALFDALGASSSGGGGYLEGFSFLSEPVERWLTSLSQGGLVAYVEAEFFGGTGSRAAVAWRDGAVALPPGVTTNEPDEPGERKQPRDHDWAINRALRLMGAGAGAAVDEFDGVGLGAHRDTEDWLQP
jgi:hypothetical protein